jgi:hypothetical protein
MVNSGFAMARFGLFAVPELLLMRLLQSRHLTWARSNMIVVLRSAVSQQAAALDERAS